jgi:hypothetical protein
MAKRKLPKILAVRNECKREEGIKPFKRETKEEKRRIEACVARKMGK